MKFRHSVFGYPLVIILALGCSETPQPTTPVVTPSATAGTPAKPGSPGKKKPKTLQTQAVGPDGIVD